MNLEETKILVERVKGTYPTFNFLGTQTLTAWQEVFKTVSLEQAQKALSQYVKDGNKYAPNAASILKLIKPESVIHHENVRYLNYDKATNCYFVRTLFEDGTKTDTIVEREHEDSNTWIDKNGYLYAVPEV